MGIFYIHLAAVDKGASPVGLYQPEKDVHKGGFSRAILADDAVDFPFANLKGDIIIRQHPGVAFSYAAHLHCWDHKETFLYYD